MHSLSSKNPAHTLFMVPTKVLSYDLFSLSRLEKQINNQPTINQINNSRFGHIDTGKKKQISNHNKILTWLQYDLMPCFHLRVRVCISNCQCDDEIAHETQQMVPATNLRGALSLCRRTTNYIT